MLRSCLFTLLLLSQVPAWAQVGVRVRRYFDDETDLIKEEFTVRDTLSNVLEGPFVAYFSNGQVDKQGYYKNNLQSGHWKFYYENGNLLMEGDYENGQVVGKWKYYYEKKGTLSAEGVLFNNLRQETWVEYYESGQRKSEGKYLDGRKVGVWNFFYEDGTLKAQAYYERGRGIYEEYFASGKAKARGLNVNGRSDSTWQFYYESGALRSQGDYDNGIRQGPWSFFHENGKVMAEGNYRDGQPDGKWNYYYSDGTLNSEGALQMGKREGFWKIYDRQGVYKGEGVFEQGEGQYREYYESGKLRAVGTIKDDQNEGQWYYYYEDGQLEGECFFLEGRGEYIGYYPDSTIKTRGIIEDGKWIGEWQLFNEDGSLAAYYRPVYPEETPIFMAVAPTPPPTPERRGDYDKPDYRFREQRFNYFKPKSNEFVGLTIGGNPLMFPLGWIPISMELFYQERLGYELEAGYIQTPFFISRNVELQPRQARGAYLAVRQKFYHTDKAYGMLYFGHELRYTFLNYTEGQTGTDQNPVLVSADGFRVEYLLLGGSRFITRKDFNGFTVDVYGGLGGGINQIPKEIEPDRQMQLSFRPWFGINFGYMFFARSKNQMGG